MPDSLPPPTAPARIIAVCVAKGGVGKSTLTYALGAEFARRGQNVLVIDCDDSRDSAQWVIDAAVPGLSTLCDAAGQPLDVTEETITGHLKAAAQAYDVVLVDLHGGMTALMTYAIARADLVVVPARLSEHDVNAVFRTERAIRTTEDAFDKTIARRVLLTQLSTFHTQVEAKTRADLEAAGIAVFRSALMRRTAFEKMSHSGQPLAAIDGEDGNAQLNLMAIADEIEHLLPVAVR